jgi:hypothetical protein
LYYKQNLTEKPFFSEGRMHSKSTFLRENFVVVLGITLPLLLIVLFSLARVFSNATVAPPQYRAVYAQGAHYYGQFHYDVGPDKKLVITYDAPHYNSTPVPQPTPVTTTVYVADAKTGKLEKHNYTIANAYSEGVTRIDNKDLTVTIETEGTTAPDGYIYTHNTDSYSGGIVPEIFGYGHRYDNSHTIAKSGRSFTLESANPYDVIDFIGWTKD